MMVAETTIVLKCSCCDLPFAVIQRGVLVIVSRHHGDRHINTVVVADLLRALQPTVPAEVVPAVLDYRNA